MKCISFLVSFLVFGASLFADPTFPWLKDDNTSKMESVAILTPSMSYTAMKSPHAFCIFEKSDLEDAEQSMVSFIAFENRLVFSHVGNGAILKDFAAFQFRDSLQQLPEKSWGYVSTQAGDIFLFCNQDVLNYLAKDNIEDILKNNPDINGAVQILIEAARNEGADGDVSMVLIKIGS